MSTRRKTLPDSPLRLKAVPFAEAIRAARARGVVLPDAYYGELHGLARSLTFSVAGLSKLDQIQQVSDSLAQALESGGTFESWKKKLLKSPQALALPDHRLDNIFRTNIQSAYARGRWEKTTRNKGNRPYLMYSAINDSRTRPHHAAMDGMVAVVDDPIWESWYPPSGYRCRCSVITLSERQADRYRQRDEQRQNDNPALRQERLNARPDKGWDYHPGRAPTEGVRRAINQRRERCGVMQFARKARGRCLDQIDDILQRLETPLDRDKPMPDPRPTQTQLLPTGLSGDEYAKRFLAEFAPGGEGSAVLQSVYDLPLLISSKMLRAQSGAWKSDKRGRGPYLPLVADAIKAPDEIWVEENSRYEVVKLYYLARFQLRSKIIRAIAVFKSADRVFEGLTAYVTGQADYFEDQRGGGKRLLYKRGV
jgi:SPP1 gp7 family putative phage head morphogenesis protein